MHKDKPVPHVHTEVIKAWADGQDVEWSFDGYEWSTANLNSGEILSWSPKVKYRVKPKSPKVIELYANAGLYKGSNTALYSNNIYVVGDFSDRFIPTDNLKLTFCPNTGKLIAAEVVEHKDVADYE